jgi:hypothetical protein
MKSTTQKSVQAHAGNGVVAAPPVLTAVSGADMVGRIILLVLGAGAWAAFLFGTLFKIEWFLVLGLLGLGTAIVWAVGRAVQTHLDLHQRGGGQWHDSQQ